MEIEQNVNLLYDSIIRGEISELDLESALNALYQHGIFVGANDKEPLFEEALDDVLKELKL